LVDVDSSLWDRPWYEERLEMVKPNLPWLNL